MRWLRIGKPDDVGDATGVQLSPTGTVCLVTGATAHLLVDVAGSS